MPYTLICCNFVGLKQATIEAKVMLAHILKEFYVETSQKEEDIKISYQVLGFPHPKLQLKFTQRSSIKK
jgi:hypothetical protein